MTPESVRKVAIVGATGFTGRLVARKLAARDVPLTLIGRNADRLSEAARGIERCEVRAVPTWDEDALAEAMSGSGAVVACAGPFVRAGGPVVRAAVRAGVSYCDSTGEQPFIRYVFEKLDDEAREAGIPLVPAFGYDYVPGDLGAAIAAEGLGPLTSVDVVYVVESLGTSPGTRLSAIEAMGRPGYQYANGNLCRERIGARRRAVGTPLGRRTAGSIPSGEAITVPRHLEVDTVVTYLSMPGPVGPSSPAAPLASLLLAVPGVAAALKRVAAAGPSGPSDREREGRIFVHAQATARDGRQRAVIVEGRDVYGFTADALAELAIRFADGGVAPDRIGACAPAQVVEPREFLEATGFSVTEVEPE
ncbi:MAG: saccharopine dehydrogenase NADP-binding domain-containing protein [Chloroflexi bacterium]|nr:saccharopine dehydrogenase NADP-binding domain-containing protein [Chloroflexota bacterium]